MSIEIFAGSLRANFRAGVGEPSFFGPGHGHLVTLGPWELKSVCFVWWARCLR